MAWLARSIANSLKLDEDDDDENERINVTSDKDSGGDQPTSPLQSQSQSPRGVKEDLSELTKALRSQFWGVASFIAPPVATSDRSEKSQTSDHVEENRTSSDLGGEEDLITGIRNDFAEIGGRFKTGISKISGNIAVSEFTKIASNFLQLGPDEENSKEYSVGDVVGVTEEVVTFARDIAMHPETWLDFPLPDGDDDFDEFEMSDVQQEHALAVERLAPALAALRIELCPTYMSESCFWRIYFVLLHPKLSKHDALFLSTLQVLEARALLSHELHRRSKVTVSAESSRYTVTEAPMKVEPCNPATEPVPLESIDVETEKYPIESKEIQVVDKSVIEERREDDKQQNPSIASSGVVDVQIEDDIDDWLKDEEDISGSISVNGTNMPIGNDEDVSFSDLEDDEERDVPVVSYKKMAIGSDPVDQDQATTVSENKWLDIDDM